MRAVTRSLGDTYYEDNGQILENCVDRYGEVLLRTIDSGTKEGRPTGETLTRLLEPVYITTTRKALTGSHALASCMLESRNEMMPSVLTTTTHAIQTILCKESNRKVILNWCPDTTNYAGVNYLT